MIKEIKREYSEELNAIVRSFIADTEADAANLPESPCSSNALVIETGDVYMVNTAGVWTKVGG